MRVDAVRSKLFDETRLDIPDKDKSKDRLCDRNCPKPYNVDRDSIVDDISGEICPCYECCVIDW